jgi:hypothetical protein
MWQLIIAIIAAVVIGAAVTAFVFWDDIRDRLAGWLRGMDWHKSVLMDALVRLDIIAGKVRCRLFATVRQTNTVHQIDEKLYDLEQVDDHDVRAELRRRGLVERSVLHLIN